MRVYISLTLVDSQSRRTRKEIEIVDQGTYADNLTLLSGFLTDLAAVSDLGVERADIVYKAAGTGYAAQSASNIDVGATFVGELYNKDGARATFKLPGIKSSKWSSDGSVSITDADVEDVLERFTQALPANMKLSDGDLIDHWIAGKLDK